MQNMAILTSAFTRIAKQALDMVFPITCGECGIRIDSATNPGTVCEPCRDGYLESGDVTCPVCEARVPSEELFLPQAGCYCCMRENTRMTGIVALGAYHTNKRLTDMILNMKHGGKPWYAREFGCQLAESVRRKYPHTSWDTVVAVPLHRTRLWKRGYNQAALVAGFMASNMGIPAYKWLLERVRKTAPQSGGREHRQQNIQNAFLSGGVCQNARIILVDDVVTTGATVAECASELYRAGALEVLVAACAWVPVLNKNRELVPGTEKKDECSETV